MSAQLQLFESRDNPEWVVRVSRRARRLSVRVYPGGRVEVVVPPGASAATVQRFVGVHRDWIDRRVQDLSAVRIDASERKPTSIDMAAVRRRFTLTYEAAASPLVRVGMREGNDALHLTGAVHDERQIAAALLQWLARFASQALAPELDRAAAECGLQYSRMQVRRQRTRWGSCSLSGTISLNMCVLFLDPPVLRYLLVHELSHTRHMNHSERFWAQVAAFEPDYRRLDRELTRGWRRVPAWVFG